MQKKKTAHNKANETKNAKVTARATEKVIVDKKTPEKEETEREEVPKSGKAKLISILSAVVLALILIFKPELLLGAINSVATESADGVYAAFIDVGQGDSIFLRSPNGKTMLVDAGTPDSFESIQNVLSEEGVTKLDVVVMTHPHSDHMGSMKRVIDNYNIGTFYMPDAVNTTSSFDRMLSALEKKKVKTKVIWGSAKTTINWDGDVEVRVLSPIKGADYQDNLNDMSVVIKVTYGETSLLLTGDAESYAEELMIASEKELLQADVLKIGHHGSSTSSSQAFLDAVQPKAVVISLGKTMIMVIRIGKLCSGLKSWEQKYTAPMNSVRYGCFLPKARYVYSRGANNFSNSSRILSGGSFSLALSYVNSPLSSSSTSLSCV